MLGHIIGYLLHLFSFYSYRVAILYVSDFVVVPIAILSLKELILFWFVYLYSVLDVFASLSLLCLMHFSFVFRVTLGSV